MPRRAPAGGNGAGTADRILDVAEELLQTYGFNGFSYAHIAAQIGVTTASLHYHYATKSALGQRLIARYGERFQAALERIEAEEPSAPGRLARYAQVYEDVLRKRRMCLCGMLAADHATLPEEMRAAVIAFFDLNEAWLRGVLERGRKAGELTFSGSPGEQARLLVGALEGAMLVARSYGDVARFTSAARRLLADLGRPRATRT